MLCLLQPSVWLRLCFEEVRGLTIILLLSRGDGHTPGCHTPAARPPVTGLGHIRRWPGWAGWRGSAGAAALGAIWIYGKNFESQNFDI